MEIIGVDGTTYTVPHSFVDFTGKQVGRLSVKGICGKSGKHYFYMCKCSCGNDKVVNKRELLAGDTKSCGCLFEEAHNETTKRFTEKYKTHGLAGTREHKAWKRIKGRTCNPNNSEYADYSVLGMEESWKNDFMLFLDHIGEIPDDRPRWSIGRVDNTKGYFEGNVRWERDDQQAKNKGKYSNNKSGKTGVYLQKIKGIPHAWVASWYSLGGEPKSKYYTIGKYGEELSKFLAEEKRDLELTKLKLAGVEYGEHHGK